MTPKFYKKLMYYCRKLAYQHQDADDIFQECIERLLKYPIEGELSNKLIYTLARRARYNFYFNQKTKEKWVRELTDEFFNALAEVQEDEYTPESLYYFREKLNKVKKLEKIFIGRQREVFKLIMLEASNEEIARRLNISHTAAGSNRLLVMQKIYKYY